MSNSCTRFPGKTCISNSVSKRLMSEIYMKMCVIIKLKSNMILLKRLLREGDTCARIQLQRCSPALAETFSAVEKQLLTTNCYYADASVINASPYSNRMAYCAAPVMAEAYQRFANRPWAFDDEHVTSFACK